MVELMWQGQYDSEGKRTIPLRVALPFQTVETVNESAQERERNLFAYAVRQDETRCPSRAASGVHKRDAVSGR